MVAGLYNGTEGLREIKLSSGFALGMVRARVRVTLGIRISGLEFIELHYSIISIILSDNTRIDLFIAAHYR